MDDLDLYYVLSKHVGKEITKRQIEALPKEKQEEFLKSAGEVYQRAKYRRLSYYQPFPKQSLAHELASSASKFMFSAANQVGKTYWGAAHMAIHVSGRYANWWTGKKYKGNITVWCCGVTAAQTRDVMQKYLFGDLDDIGTGLIPKDNIIQGSIVKGQIGNALDTVKIRREGGGVTTLRFKNYEQVSNAWAGEPVDLLWLDEEPPELKHEEAVARTLDTEGSIYLTFTPLLGRTTVVEEYMVNSEGVGDPCWLRMGIDDRPDLTQEQKDKRKAKVPKHLWDARIYGIPYAGEGRVFSEEVVETATKNVTIMSHWKVIGGIDFGGTEETSHPSALIKMMMDTRDGTKYIVKELKTKMDRTKISSQMNKWDVPIWSYPRDGLQTSDGVGKMMVYRQEGIKFTPEDAHWKDDKGRKKTDVEPIVDMMLLDMEKGDLIIDASCTDLLTELRGYQRIKEKRTGLFKLQKHNDDLIDAARYAYLGALSGYAKSSEKQMKVMSRKKKFKNNQARDPRDRIFN